MRQVTIPVPDARETRTWILRLVVLVLGLWLAYIVREIWLPLGLAFLIALVLDPVVDRMEARGWKRASATAFIFGSFLLITTGLIVLAWPYVIGQTEALQAGFNKNFPDPSHDGMVKTFRKMNLPDWVASIGIRIFDSARANFAQSSTWLTAYGMRFLSNLVWVVIVPIVAFYALRDFHMILAKGLLVVPSRHRNVVQTAVTEISAVFARFLRGLAIVSAMNGVATWLLLFVLRVPSALVLGIVAGVLYGVPYLGAILTTILTAAVAFLAGGVTLMTVAVVSSVILHSVVFDQIITPRILGGHVGLHPILSIVALLAGNLVLGIIGMILAVPIAACIQIAVLALVPKLGHEIELPSPHGPGTSVPELEAETLEDHLKADTPSEIHKMVTNAVENVEREVNVSDAKDDPPPG
ncbi:MAG: AI-2E family transporter [Fimbriimonas sp.]